ncbi:MAG: carbohydrate-binding family 9-like protein [Candidatus Sumerlaeia bacterium]|nr:carbohydrate-binding family 9-like protein [Candidatus Sumerlaeia bacterium]
MKPRQFVLSLFLLPALPLAIQASSPPTVWECIKTTGTIVIDGRVDEKAWLAAPVLSFYQPITHAPATSKTEGRILWDDTHLYVSFVAEDHDLRATESRRDHPVFYDDCLEFFFQVEGANRYYNIEINAKGTVFDARGGSPRDFKFENMRHAVHLDGTLNDSSDVDTGWSLELAIPFSDIVELNGQPPQPGDRWRFHLSRYDYDDRFEDGKELTSTAALSRVSFHYRADWKELVFKYEGLRMEDELRF